MLGSARGVLGLVIVKACRRHDLDHAERLLAHDGAGQLLAGDVFFDDDPIAIRPILAIELLRRMGVIRRNDEYPDARALRDRLDHIRRRQQMSSRRFEPRGYESLGHRHASRSKQRLGDILLHGDRRGHHAGMGVGDASDFQETLERTVLAGTAVQDIERDIGFHGGEDGSDITADVDSGDAIAQPEERLGTGFSGAQRDFALGRPTSHQDGDVFAHALPSRLIRS